MTALLLDEMYPPLLAIRLREAGHDVVAASAVEVGLASRSDDELLAWAQRNGRCVVTENIRDFAGLATHSTHAGVILVLAKRFPRSGSGLNGLYEALDGVLRDKTWPQPGEMHWLG